MPIIQHKRGYDIPKAAPFDGDFYSVYNRDSDLNNVPSPFGDGCYFVLPIASTASMDKKDAGGNTIWTVVDSDINAASDLWGGIWFDPVDDKIYALAVDTGTTNDTGYWASIDPYDGSITNIATIADLTVDGFSITENTYNCWRGTRYSNTPGSGDFFVRNATYEMRISAAGAIVEAYAQRSSNGNTIVNNYGYTSKDGTVHAQIAGVAGEGFVKIFVQRGGGEGGVPIQLDPGAFSQLTTAHTFALWSTDKVIESGLFVNVSGAYAKLWMRKDFDAWLHKMADLCSLPRGVVDLNPVMTGLSWGKRLRGFRQRHHHGGFDCHWSKFLVGRKPWRTSRLQQGAYHCRRHEPGIRPRGVQGVRKQ